MVLCSSSASCKTSISCHKQVNNPRDISNGTTIPTSTLVIHFPVAVQTDRNSNFQPLLIPYQFFTASNDITCSGYDIIAEDLLVSLNTYLTYCITQCQQMYDYHS